MKDSCKKQQVDKKIDAKKGLISRVARKMMPIIKKKDRERLKKVRSQKENLMIENHKVLTLSVNGSQPEVSAFEKDGRILPYVFKSISQLYVNCNLKS